MTMSYNYQKMSWLKLLCHQQQQRMSLAENEKENLGLNKHIFADLAVDLAMSPKKLKLTLTFLNE